MSLIPFVGNFTIRNKHLKAWFHTLCTKKLTIVFAIGFYEFRLLSFNLQSKFGIRTLRSFE